MGIWEFLLVLIIVGSVYKLIKFFGKQRIELRIQDEHEESIDQRFEKIEKRLANLETIVIDQRKKDDFEKL